MKLPSWVRLRGDASMQDIWDHLMVKIVAQPVSTDEVELAITVTMPVGRWKQLAEQLGPGSTMYPGWWVLENIRNAVATFTARQETPLEVER